MHRHHRGRVLHRRRHGRRRRPRRPARRRSGSPPPGVPAWRGRPRQCVRHQCSRASAGSGDQRVGPLRVDRHPLRRQPQRDHPVRPGCGRGRGHLGAGLVEVPPVPARDPATAVLADPQVPESKRFCATCERPVGRGRDGQAGPDRGVLPALRQPVLVRPQAARPASWSAASTRCSAAWPTAAWAGSTWPGTATSGDRWVVLKGLLNTGDADAHGGGGGRAAVPGRGRAPQHRRGSTTSCSTPTGAPARWPATS